MVPCAHEELAWWWLALLLPTESSEVYEIQKPLAESHLQFLRGKKIRPQHTVWAK